MGEDLVNDRPVPVEATSKVIEYQNPSGFVFGSPSKGARVVARLGIVMACSGAVVVFMGFGWHWDGEESGRLHLYGAVFSVWAIAMGLLSLYLGNRPGRARSPGIAIMAKLAVAFGVITLVGSLSIPSINR